MAEYIDRKAVGLTDFEIFMCNGNYKEAFKMLLDKIDSISAADVVPGSEFRDCRNELCLKCEAYQFNHKTHECDGCRWSRK